MVDKINDGAEENRISFPATRGSVHETAFLIYDMLPCFLLESKGPKTPGREPVADNLVAGRRLLHTTNLTGKDGENSEQVNLRGYWRCGKYGIHSSVIIHHL